MRVDQRVSPVRAVEVPVLLCLRSSHVTGRRGRKVCETGAKGLNIKITGTLWMKSC